MQQTNSILSSRTGDYKIDETNKNSSKYFIEFLRNYENEVSRIDAKKNHFTEAGLVKGTNGRLIL